MTSFAQSDSPWTETRVGLPRAVNALAGVTYGTANVDPIALHLRKAFNAAAIRQYGDASVEVSATINSTEDPRVKGWLQEQLAVTYIRPTP